MSAQQMEDPRPCQIRLTIAPSSSKWFYFDWPKSDIKTATISAYTWTVPSGFANAAESQSGLRVGIRLTAPATEGATGWLELQITTSATETRHQRFGVLVTKDAQ